LLAGRKLLLADDSVTIQKVIDLTFTDEGVEVITVGDGEQAIEKVEQLLPDIVLADVFMPIFNGYEVCEHIKGSEKLKHIPVMLLVGSFEPFDEAEARRVGADDTLTKPFQSIRRLIDKVGELVGSKPPKSEVPTAELPAPEEPEQPLMSTSELEIATADTLRLPANLTPHTPKFSADRQVAEPALIAEPAFNENKMESQSNGAQSAPLTEMNDSLLDLGDFEPAEAIAADDFELDLGLDEPEKIPAPMAYSTAFAEPQVAAATPVMSWEESARERPVKDAQFVGYGASLPAGSVADESHLEQRTYHPQDSQPVLSGAIEQPAAQAPLTAQSLSPELIDAIARRAVEHLSERVVQEIAWEVVPQLAELLIKRQLEQKESQTK
jgi:CheY-like chemotaxis protein